MLSTATAAADGTTAGDLQGLALRTAADPDGVLTLTVDGLQPGSTVVAGVDAPSGAPSRTAVRAAAAPGRTTLSLRGVADGQGRAVLRSAAGGLSAQSLARAVVSLTGTGAGGRTAAFATTGSLTARLTPPVLTVSRTSVPPGQPVDVTVRSAPGARVLLLARDVRGERGVRAATVPASGVLTWTLRPSARTTLSARASNVSGLVQGPARTVQVVSRLSGSTTRTSASSVVVRGGIAPRRAGATVLVTATDAATGRRFVVGRGRTAADGSWTVLRRFTGRALLTLEAATSADAVGSEARARVGRLQVG